MKKSLVLSLTVHVAILLPAVGLWRTHADDSDTGATRAGEVLVIPPDPEPPAGDVLAPVRVKYRSAPAASSDHDAGNDGADLATTHEATAHESPAGETLVDEGIVPPELSLSGSGDATIRRLLALGHGALHVRERDGSRLLLFDGQMQTIDNPERFSTRGYALGANLPIVREARRQAMRLASAEAARVTLVISNELDQIVLHRQRAVAKQVGIPMASISSMRGGFVVEPQLDFHVLAIRTRSGETLELRGSRP